MLQDVEVVGTCVGDAVGVTGGLILVSVSGQVQTPVLSLHFGVDRQAEIRERYSFTLEAHLLIVGVTATVLGEVESDKRFSQVHRSFLSVTLENPGQQFKELQKPEIPAEEQIGVDKAIGVGVGV